jgi:glycosyltransferase involved in cell wall biosynthesis
MAVWLGQLTRADFSRLIPGAELFHATEHLLMPLRDLPTVLTVHDLIYHLFPQYHKRLNYTYLNAAMPLYVQRADAVVTISESSKRDLVRLYGVDPQKVTVIYEAASAHLRPAPRDDVDRVRQAYGLPESFVITVGTIEPRKNLSRLLDALMISRRSGHDVGLVIVGSKGWLYEGFYRKLEQHEGREHVLLTGYLPDEDLAAVYSAAQLCVVPSLYEGFGLPVLEAMACGTPVACSNVSSLPELGGPAALYFDPCDAQEMAGCIGQLAGQPALREELRAKGMAQAARFSWERTARETFAVYQKVVGARA